MQVRCFTVEDFEIANAADNRGLAWCHVLTQTRLPSRATQIDRERERESTQTKFYFCEVRVWKPHF